MQRFGFGGLCLLVGLVSAALQAYYSMIGSPPSWIGAVGWLSVSAVLIIVGIWFWDWSAERHWITRTVATLLVVLLAGAFGYPSIRKEYAREHQQIDPPNGQQQQQSQKPRNVQQSNQGNGNNTNIVGNGNTVTNNNKTIVVQKEDPRVKSLFDYFEQFKKENEDEFNTDKLLARFPLGYEFFGATYNGMVFADKAWGGEKKLELDWSTFQVERTKSGIDVSMPTAYWLIDGRPDGPGLYLHDDVISCPSEIPSGKVCSGSFAVKDTDMVMWVLNTNKNGIVLLIGFNRHSLRSANRSE